MYKAMYEAVQTADPARSARPIDDRRGTVAYRKQVSGVLTRRAARIAYERAKAR